MSQTLAFINPRLSTQNVGDLFIEDSVKRILDYDRAHSIEIDPRRPISPGDIDRINATEAAVIVGTNLWYRDMPRLGRWCFSLDELKRIRVPIIPFGIGTTRHAGEDNGFHRDTLAQIRLIHASCAAGSVRDVRTAEALEEAGISNVVMTGCPTLFRSLELQWTLKRNLTSRHVVVTVRNGQRANVRVLLRQLREAGLKPVIAAQQENDLIFRRTIPFLQKGTRTLYRYDLQPYLHLVEASVGVIGWRLHGNMLHLAHGRPAGFFANCSRAESFCDSFGLPSVACEDHERISREQIQMMIDLLWDDATFAELPKHYAEHRARMARFLDANGLRHHLRPAAAVPVAKRRAA
jgi:hypothetical protein